MLRELRATIVLAWPLVLAEVGWVLMGVVDTISVGPLGPVAIGAVSTGSTVFFAFTVLGIGVFYALDTFVSQNAGAGRADECRRWLSAALQLAVVLSIAVIVVGFLVADGIGHLGIHPDVLGTLQRYLRLLLWSAPPLLGYTVLRRYLQALHRARPVMVAVVIANAINALANWVLIYGHWGMPALGVPGSAWATILARLSLFAMLGGVVVASERTRTREGLSGGSFQLEIHRMRRLLGLGLPVAVQVVLEVGVFTAASLLAGRISPAALAANQIVLNIASFFFMVPLGLASAAAVRVGHAVGRGDAASARGAGAAAITLALMASVLIGLVFVSASRPILGLFTSDTAVIGLGGTVLLVWAVIQPFDGLQAVITGALRGAGETRIPMWANLAGHWAGGLPVAWWLCFVWGWGIVGLWVGLGLSLVGIGTALLVVWRGYDMRGSQRMTVEG